MTQLATISPDDQQLRTRGKAQKRDRDALALLALLSDADVVRVASTWDRLAPKAYRGLAGASASSPTIAPASRFWFDPDRLQFANGTRGYIPENAVRSALNVFNRNAAAEFANMGEYVARGTISIPIWQESMYRQIKDAQLVNAAIGRGGENAIEGGDLKAISSTLEYQFGRLGRFAEQLEDGEGAATVHAAGARAGHYAESAISTFDGMRRRAADVAGYTMERNLLGNAEHCQPDPRRPNIPDCPSLTALGWVSLGELPPIGYRLCLWNCACGIRFRRS